MLAPAASAASPVPASVSITAPAAGGVVKASPMSVTAVGTTDVAAADAPASMQLTLDGIAQAKIDCPDESTATHSCTVMFSVKTSRLSGPHVLRVTMTTLTPTSVPATAVSSPLTFYAYSPVKVALSKVATVAAGKSTTIRGVASLA